MRKHIANLHRQVGLVSATLAILLATACGTTSLSGVVANPSQRPTATCAGSGAMHAYVVVQHLDGSVVERCVAFTGSIKGKQLMDQSGITYQSQTFSFGIGVCSIDNEPATFTQCFPQGKPYWSLFVEHLSTWTPAQTGFDQITLNDKDALGWRYVPAADQTPSPPPLAPGS